jgi:D-aminopeptidase
MGESLTSDMPRFLEPSLLPPELREQFQSWRGPADGSVIVVIATDAPLMPHQLKRLAKRPSLAIGRLGGVGAASSGDIFLAISTANASVSEARGDLSARSQAKIHPAPRWPHCSKRPSMRPRRPS